MAKTKEKKAKETKWTEQKMLHKYDENGVLMPNVYRKFGWETWKRMTADERAMWGELSEATPAPISKEVIDFKEKAEKKEGKFFEPSDEEQARASIKAELKKRGIKFAYNSKIETLEKKLADADNPE